VSTGKGGRVEYRRIVDFTGMGDEFGKQVLDECGGDFVKAYAPIYRQYRQVIEDRIL
jgi:hypothetical protein